ncbi:MAG TPA: hypothetical protein VF752_05555 [Thermoleophilaceae bacterium]
MRSSSSIAVVAATAAIAVGAAHVALGDPHPAVLASAGTGDVQIGNSRAGQAIVTADRLAPGGTASGTVTISNAGSADGAFFLSAVDTVGTLISALQLRVDDLSSAARVYDGSFAGLSQLALGNFAPGEAHAYRFTVALGAGAANALQGAEASVSFRWDAEARTAPITTEPQPAPAPEPAPAPVATSATPAPVITQLSRNAVKFSASCSSACTVKGAGSVKVKGMRGRVKLTPVTKKLTAGGKASITLAVPGSARVALRKALKRGNKPVATATITATDASGRTTTVTRRITLKI